MQHTVGCNADVKVMCRALQDLSATHFCNRYVHNNWGALQGTYKLTTATSMSELADAAT